MEFYGLWVEIHVIPNSKLGPLSSAMALPLFMPLTVPDFPFVTSKKKDE